MIVQFILSNTRMLSCLQELLTLTWKKDYIDTMYSWYECVCVCLYCPSSHLMSVVLQIWSPALELCVIMTVRYIEWLRTAHVSQELTLHYHSYIVVVIYKSGFLGIARSKETIAVVVLWTCLLRTAGEHRHQRQTHRTNRQCGWPVIPKNV